jgi:hypothetical protein
MMCALERIQAHRAKWACPWNMAHDGVPYAWLAQRAPHVWPTKPCGRGVLSTTSVKAGIFISGFGFISVSMRDL